MKKVLMITVTLLTSVALFAQGNYTANHPVKEPYTTGLFRSVAGTYFDLKNDQTLVNAQFSIVNWLQGRVAGLQVHNIRGTSVPFIRNYPAAIYVDEIRTDATFLNMLPVNDIASVKIMRSPSVLSTRGGAIAIYTKRGEEEEKEEAGK